MPIPLLGRDLLTKLGARISVEQRIEPNNYELEPRRTILILSLNTPREEEWRLFESEAAETNPEYYRTKVPGVWAESNPSDLPANGPLS